MEHIASEQVGCENVRQVIMDAASLLLEKLFFGKFFFYFIEKIMVIQS